MPNIPKRFLDCVFYLYRSKEDARAGVAAGGCGFFVSLASEHHGDKGWAYRYAVTCGHLIKAGFLTIRVNTEDKETECFETTPADWELSEENDVAASEIDLDDGKHIYQSVYDRVPPAIFEKFPRAFDYPRLSQLVTEKIINENGIGTGDEVFLVGRLIDNSGLQQNTPCTRFGNISMMPFDPVHNEYLNRPVEVFLCEVKSIGGFSGSPVFVYLPALSWRPNSNTRTMERGPWLLGIDWGHTFRRDVVRNNTDGQESTGGYHVRRDSGIACVAPAWHIDKLLDCERFRRQREKEDAEIEKKNCEATTEVGATEKLRDRSLDTEQIAKSVVDRQANS